MKMSDVFALPMTQGITCVMSKDHRHEIVFDESDSNVSDQIEHVAHAINNHDRMAEEIAELKGDSLELIKAIKFLYKNTKHINELQSKNIESMIEYHEAKLNQEGEELNG